MELLSFQSLIQTNVISPATANTAYGAIGGTSFAQTCPLTINFLPGNQYAANTTFITAGCFIAKSQTSIGGSGTAITIPQIPHMMNACRMYYSQVSLSPQKALAYVEANTAKQVVYESYLYLSLIQSPSPRDRQKSRMPSSA